MSTMRRATLWLAVAIAVPVLGTGLAVAGGGVFPTFPGDVGFVLNPANLVSAVIVIDPNGPVSVGAAATPTGAFGTIAITRQGTGTAIAVFRVEPDSSLGELQFGCNLLRTNSRFLEFAPGTPGLPLGGPSVFSNWLPPGVTTKLFGDLGIQLVDPATFTVLRIPAITAITSQQCAPFPKAKDTVSAALFDDILKGLHQKVAPPAYPDLSGNSVGTDPATQWGSGFLVLEVRIGFWAQQGTSTP